MDESQFKANEETPEPETLEHLEKVIENGRGNLEASADALLEIHDKKLYKKTYRSFGAYLSERWGWSRSRGYQLLHYAQLKKVSTEVDNERQARRRDSKGKPRLQQDEDPILEAMNYVTDLFERLVESEKRELISFMRDRLCELEKELTSGSQQPGVDGLSAGPTDHPNTNRSSPETDGTK